MNMIDAPTLLTIIYVLVDDWYQEQGYRFIPILFGPEPSFSESEMLTLLLAMDYFPLFLRTTISGIYTGKLLEPVSQALRPEPVQSTCSAIRRTDGGVKTLLG